MNINIEFSPFNEMIASIHVLYNPVHHPYRKKWAEETELKLPKTLLKDIRTLGSHFYEWLYFINICNEYKFHQDTVEEVIERIFSISDEVFLFYILGEKYSIEDIKKWHIDNKDASLSKEQMEFIKFPNKLKTKLRDLFYEYNEKVYARELFRISPWVTRASSNFQQKIDQSIILALNEVHPDVFVDGEYIKVQKGDTYHFSLQEYNNIILQPSTFITPHIMLGVYPNRLCFGLHVAVPEVNRFDEPPLDLVLILKALSEENRLKILRDIFYHPFSTKQLAERYGITEATISKHLKILQNAGLITCERKGYYIFYSGKREKIESLRSDLSQFINLPVLEDFIFESDKT